jgi:hypothetical protein
MDRQAMEIDLVELADELVEIARKTSDPETGYLLLEVVHRLLTAAGLPRDDETGGGDSPLVVGPGS